MSAHSPPLSPASASLPLDAHAIRRELGMDAAGWQIRVLEAVDSTNSALLQEARNTPDAFSRPVLLTTAMQTAGRGRAGRVWQALPGASLTLSCGWRMQRPLAELSGLSLVCGLAVHAAALQQGVRTRLKWPNDVLAGNDGALRKLGGILVETQVVPNQPVTLLVIGIGINLTADAHALLPRENNRPGSALQATDLQTEGARQPVDRNRLSANLAQALAARLKRFEADGFAVFADDWNAVHAFQDQPVRVLEQERVIHEGIACGVNAAGQLRLDTPSGPQWINSGDLSLRPR